MDEIAMRLVNFMDDTNTKDTFAYHLNEKAESFGSHNEEMGFRRI